MRRSQSQKQKYFENHNVEKKAGFELHHVVSLFMAKNRNQYSDLDVWQNMIYIDAFTHSRLHDTSRTYFRIKFDGDDLLLNDIVEAKKNEPIHCQIDTNIIYNPKKQDDMLKCNQSILDYYEKS